MTDTIHVKVPKELFIWLRRKAKDEDRSLGWVLRQLALEQMRRSEPSEARNS